jgi:hypothetical protein
MSYHIMSYHIMSYHIISYHTTPAAHEAYKEITVHTAYTPYVHTSHCVHTPHTWRFAKLHIIRGEYSRHAVHSTSPPSTINTGDSDELTGLYSQLVRVWAMPTCNE